MRPGQAIATALAAACAFAALGPILGALGPALAATPDLGGSRAGKVYRLERTSTYQTGCFPPCLCPIFDASRVRGVFRLTPAGSSGDYDLYAVTDVNWRSTSGGSELAITGSGTYRLGRGANPSQQLILDLEIGEHPVQRYNSGLVPAETDFPRIDVQLFRHGGQCFDTAIGVRSKPLAAMLSGRGGDAHPRPRNTADPEKNVNTRAVTRTETP